MIVGTVTPDDVSVVRLVVAEQMWAAMIDTGFNGDLELPEVLRAFLNARWIGRDRSLLAAGQSVLRTDTLWNFLSMGRLLAQKPLLLWAMKS